MGHGMKALVLIASLGLLVSACGGGGGGGDGGSSSPPPTYQPPSVTINAQPESGPAPLVVQFSAQIRADNVSYITRYAWDFGDGSTSTIGMVAGQHEYQTVGTFNVTLTVTDNYGGTATAKKQIVTIGRVPELSLSTSAAYVASGQTVTLTWTANYANSCTASGSWAGTKATSGREQVTVTGSPTYALTCTGPGGTTSDDVTINAGTPLSGVLPEKTYPAEDGPYVLVGRTDIAPNTTVVFPAGTQLYGQGNELRVFGTLRVVGTAAQRVRLDDVKLAPYSQTSNDRYRIELSWCDMQGGSFHAPTGNAMYGSFSVADCLLSHLPYMYIWYPAGPSEFVRNQFVDSEPIGILLDGRNSIQENLTISNNRFSGHRPSVYSPVTAIEIIEVYNPANLIIQANSFLDVGQVGIRLKTGGYTRRLIDAKGNYWGTDSYSTISSMVFDENDDLAAPGIITFDPFLTAPDPNTPP